MDMKKDMNEIRLKDGPEIRNKPCPIEESPGWTETQTRGLWVRSKSNGGPRLKRVSNERRTATDREVREMLDALGEAYEID